MRILVLGGTAWLSRAIAAHGTARGHDVTAFARGSSGDVAPGVRLIAGDRTIEADYERLDGKWDAVIDVARDPGHVRRALAALADRAAHWGLVSTVSVYADLSVAGDEDDAVIAPLAADEMREASEYGAAKSACEHLVRAAMGPDRAHIARAGLIGGPGDVSGRTVYWPWRFAHPASSDGRVLVPDADRPVQVIDARDLADWMLDAAERGVGATLDVCGERTSLAEHLGLARRVAGRGEPVSAGEDWLTAHGVAPWAGPRSLPLWLPAQAAALSDRDTGRAERLGLRRRPLAETLADGLAWRDAHPELEFGAGLDDSAERELLAELAG